MRRFVLPALGLCLATLAGCLHAPVLWSPDGHWIAYTVAIRSTAPAVVPGWLFDVNSAPEAKLSSRPVARGDAASGYRLWATRVDSGTSVLLEESRGPLTSPSWSPDGKALAFGRLVPEANGRARFEVVVQEGPDLKRVLLTRSFSEFNGRSADLPGLALAWSPDGHYLAVPWFQQGLDLAVVRADNGRVLKVVEDAYLPAWSPDGTKLAFVRGSDAESLHCLDNNFGPSRHLADIGQTSQVPVWARDGQSVFIVSRQSAPRGGEPPTPQVDLLRVRVDTGAAEKLLTLSADQADRDKAFLGASFSFDRDGENLFYNTEMEGKYSEVVWYRPRNKETYKKDHPVDISIRIGALAVSPTEKKLAMRLGPPGYLSPPGLWDLESNQFTPVVPDDSARVEWLTLLIDAERGLLRASLPPAAAGGVGAERPTWLPVPGELPTSQETTSRLRRIGRLGRSLCDRPASAPPADPALLALLDEARLFFDYLRQDYAAALSALDVLEERTIDPDRRLRLLSVRAQIALGQGRFEQATATIAYLQTVGPGAARRIEETPAGPILTDEPDARSSWTTYLKQRSQDYQATRRQGGDPADGPNGFGHRNPDAPEPPGGDLFPFAPRRVRDLPVGAPMLEPLPPIAPARRPAPPLLPRFQRRPAPRAPR